MDILSRFAVFQSNGENGTHYIDSDTGLESMSSAETATTKPCSVCVDNPMAMSNNNNNNNNNGEGNHTQVEGLKQEVTRLKCDKLDLLRQNVVSRDGRGRLNGDGKLIAFVLQNCQRDIKRLRERELSLQGDLAAAGKEILRLRELLKDCMPDREGIMISGERPL